MSTSCRIPSSPALAGRTRQFDLRLGVQQGVEIFGLKKPGFELHARRHLVGIHRMAAENDQMAAEQAACVQRSYDVGRKPRNSVHRCGDAKLGLACDLFID